MQVNMVEMVTNDHAYVYREIIPYIALLLLS